MTAHISTIYRMTGLLGCVLSVGCFDVAQKLVGEINPPETQFGVDMRRCRANALRQPGYEWSVFCVYDNIVPSVDGVLCEWSYQ